MAHLYGMQPGKIEDLSKNMLFGNLGTVKRTSSRQNHGNKCHPFITGKIYRKFMLLCNISTTFVLWTFDEILHPPKPGEIGKSLIGTFIFLSIVT
jgi:hypothetical protein